MARGRTAHDSAVSTQPEFASVDDRATRPERVRPAKRARFGAVVLTVLLTEVVLIGAGVNQAVAKHLQTFASDHRDGLSGQLVRSLLVLRWSFAPQSHHTDLWHAELITVGLTLLLSLVLVAFVVHGPITWLQSFFGTWLAVVIATTVATVAGLLLSDLEQSADFADYVVPGKPSAHLSLSQQVQHATFGAFLPRGFVAGVLLGFVVAVIVSIVAVSTRRTDPVPVATAAAEPGAVAPPEAPEAFFGSGGPDARTGYDRGPYGSAVPYGEAQPYGQTQAYGRTQAYGETQAYGQAQPSVAPASGQDSPTATLPTVGPDDAASDATTALPHITAYRPFDPPAAPLASEPTEPQPTEPAAPEVPAETESGAPQSAEPQTAEPQTATPEPHEPVDDAAQGQTQAWPAQPERPHTPAAEPAAAEPAAEPSDAEPAEDRTTEFPVPPDDEDLGHHPERTDD